MLQEEKTTPAVSAEVLAKAREGDREALSQIYEATSPEVYRTVRAMVKDEQTVLDVQQDVYVRAFSHLDQLRDTDSLLPWLKSIAVNRVRSELRKTRPTLFTDLVEEDGEAPDFPDPKPEGAPDLELDRKETSRLVREILDKLSDGQRLLIGMYYYEQMPIGRIAEDLGISEGTVKTQLHRGRKRVEAEVRRLEKQGVKLYGLSPLPFLTALLARLLPPPAREKQVLAGALSQSGAVKSAALQVGRPFFQTVLGRVVIGAALAAAVGGGIGMGKWLNKHHLPKNEPTTESTEQILYLPTEDEDPTEPPGPVVPTEPVLPDPSEPEVTEPTVTQPYFTEPPATETEDSGAQPEEPGTGPEEPGTGSEEPAAPVFLNWTWQEYFAGTSMDRNDLKPQTFIYNSPHLYVTVAGDAAPELITDNPEAIEILTPYLPDTHSDDPNNPNDIAEGTTRYTFIINYLSGGTAHLFCRLNGETVASLTLNNAYYSPTIPEEGVDFWNWKPEDGVISDVAVGSCETLIVNTMYTRPPYTSEILYPELSTDRPDIVQIIYTNQENNGGLESGTLGWWDLRVENPGTAHLTLSINGQAVKTYTLITRDTKLPVTSFSWEKGSENKPLKPGYTRFLNLTTKGDVAVDVYADPPGIVEISRGGKQGLSGAFYLETIHVTARSPGEATIYCAYEGEVLYSLPVTVVSPPDP